MIKSLTEQLQREKLTIRQLEGTVKDQKNQVEDEKKLRKEVKREYNNVKNEMENIKKKLTTEEGKVDTLQKSLRGTESRLRAVEETLVKAEACFEARFRLEYVPEKFDVQATFSGGAWNTVDTYLNQYYSHLNPAQRNEKLHHLYTWGIHHGDDAYGTISDLFHDYSGAKLDTLNIGEAADLFIKTVVQYRGNRFLRSK
ncbi:hypothetical protein HDV00_000869 [Rhizophlyctis rosea]|nr:hypothetical protein HDV00_000869 [Rhizophlyctis rosea]